ncbi:MAG TPA: biotin/lipoyl-binding protein [Rhodanobacter sp.]
MKTSAVHASRCPRTLRLVRLSGLALAATSLLAACSGPAETPDSGSAQPAAYMAVARGRIDVEGGLLNLAMPREGILVTVAVHEGDHVKKGALLASLDAEPGRLAVAAAEAQLEQARAQLAVLATRQLADRQRARRLAAAFAAGAGDGQSADDAREAAVQAGAEERAARAALDIARQKLDEARYELKQRSLLAPLAADVVRVLAQPGASVSPTSGPLLTLLPRKPRLVRAELNESFAGVIHPGMPAEIAPEGDGGRDGSFNAHVLRVGQVFGPATLDNDPQVRANARTVECVLAFDQPDADQIRDLRIGQRVLVRFKHLPVPATMSKG